MSPINDESLSSSDSISQNLLSKSEEMKAKRENDANNIQRQPRPEQPSGCVISLKNLPKNCSRNELRPVFELFGKVTVISVARNIYTGETRPFGFIRYENPLAALSAINALSTVPLTIRGAKVLVAISDKW